MSLYTLAYFHDHLDQKLFDCIFGLCHLQNPYLMFLTFCQILFVLCRGGKYNRGGKHSRSREHDTGRGRPNKAQKVEAA